VGQSGKIKKTTDGGVSWQNQVSNTSGYLGKVYFTDSLRGIAYHTALLRTLDGGNNWQFSNPVLDGSISSVHFIDENNGWLADAAGYINRTRDFGTTWDSISTVSNYFPIDIMFLDSLNGILLGITKISVTNDGGINWTQVYSNTNLEFKQITKKPNGEIWICGSNGLLLVSTNNGLNWTPSVSGISGTINFIQFVDDNNGYFASNDGFLRTNDGGQTWTPMVFAGNANLLTIQYTDNFGIFAGAGGKMFIYQWHYANHLNRNVNINDAFYKFNRGSWLACDSGYIYRTEYLTSAWQQKYQLPGINFNGVFATDYSNCWAVGDNGTIVFTDDSGRTWTQQNSTITQKLNKVFFTDSLNGTVVADSGIIIKTTDGGVTWTNINSPVNTNLNGIFYATPLIGWAAGNNGVILKTIDGGNSWIQQNANTSEKINSIEAYNIDTVYAVGNNGLILNSYNSGNNWYSNNSTVSVNLNDVSIGIYADKIFVCGDNETLLKRIPAPNVPFYNLSGTLYYDSTQQVVNNAEVYLYKYDTLDFTVMNPVATVNVNNNGVFEFEDVEPGFYAVLATANDTDYPLLIPTYYGNSFEWFNAQKINVVASTISNLDIQLSEIDTSGGNFLINGNAYIGTAQLELNNDNEHMKRSNTPAGGQLLILYDRDNGNKPITSTTTDVNGSFSFSLPVGSNYGIHLDIPGNDIDTSYALNLSGGNNQLNNLLIFIDTSIISFDIATGIEDVSSNPLSIIILYPNPTDGILHLSANSDEENHVSIFSSDGKLIDEFVFKKQISWNMKNMIQGIAIIKILNKHFSETRKVIFE
jgi:photosystem II stability/assembly factor-like uncharacterized protein